jgi:hypothetical protein
MCAAMARAQNDLRIRYHHEQHLLQQQKKRTVGDATASDETGSLSSSVSASAGSGSGSGSDGAAFQSSHSTPRLIVFVRTESMWRWATQARFMLALIQMMQIGGAINNRPTSSQSISPKKPSRILPQHTTLVLSFSSLRQYLPLCLHEKC